MSNSAEITYAIQNDRPSIMIRVSAQEEGKSKPDLREMLSQIQEAIADFQKNPQANLLPSSDVVVQDVPCSSPPPPVQTMSFPTNKEKEFSQKGAEEQKDKSEKDSPGTVTGRQFGKIRYELKKRNIPEKEFCSIHGVACIRDLSLNQARFIINQEDY